MLNALFAFVVSASASVTTAPCEQPVATPVPVAVSYQHQPEKIWHHPIKVWKDLAGAQKLDGQHYNYVRVGADQGTFDTLQLRNVSGRTEIKQVVIDFVGGGSQVVKLDKQLDARNPSLTIDLAGNHREIQRVVLSGSSSQYGSYDVFAV